MMDAIESNVMEKPGKKDTPTKGQNIAKSPQCSQAITQHAIPPEATNSLDNILKQIEKLKELIHKTPDLDIAKIQLLKEELLQGRYKIFSKEIAARILTESES